MNRTCENPECANPIPEGKSKKTRYCSDECARMRQLAQMRKNSQQKTIRSRREKEKAKTRKTPEFFERTTEFRGEHQEAPVRPPRTPPLTVDDLTQRPEPSATEPYPSQETHAAYHTLLQQWVPDQTLIEVYRYRFQNLNKWNGSPTEEHWIPILPEHRITKKTTFTNLQIKLQRDYPAGGWFQVRFYRTGVQGLDSFDRPLYFELEPSFDEADMKNVVGVYGERLEEKNEEL